jgi:hypothetical protein
VYGEPYRGFKSLPLRQFLLEPAIPTAARSASVEYRAHMISLFRFSPSRLALGYIGLGVLMFAEI